MKQLWPRFFSLTGKWTCDHTKYKQGDTVYVRHFGKLKRGKITGANLDRDMNFESWQVKIRSLHYYLSKKDPQVA